MLGHLFVRNGDLPDAADREPSAKPVPHRQRRIDIGKNLFARFVHANQRMAFVVLFAVNVENFLHMSNESGAVSFGNAKAF